MMIYYMCFYHLKNASYIHYVYLSHAAYYASMGWQSMVKHMPCFFACEETHMSAADKVTLSLKPRHKSRIEETHSMP